MSIKAIRRRYYLVAGCLIAGVCNLMLPGMDSLSGRCALILLILIQSSSIQEPANILFQIETSVNKVYGVVGSALMAIKIGLAFGVPALIEGGYWKYLIYANGIVSILGIVFILIFIQDTTFLTDKYKKELVFDYSRSSGTIVSTSSKDKSDRNKLITGKSIKSGQNRSDGSASNDKMSNQGSID